MNKIEFLQELTSVLSISQSIVENTVLSDIPEWDSLGMMSTVTMYETFCNKLVSFDDLSLCKKVEDLIVLAGINE